MAACAALGKNNLASIQFATVIGEILASAGRIFEEIGVGRLEEKQGHVRRLGLCSVPIARILLRVLDLDGRDLLTSNQRPEMENPLLAEQTDVEINAIQSTQDSHRVGTVFE